MLRRQVLWSGGFDSTFRLLSLVAAGERVAPIYLDQECRWQKQVRELDARDRILSQLPTDWRRRIDGPPVGEDFGDFWATFLRLHRQYADAGLGEWPSQDPGIAAAGLLRPGVEACYVAGDTLTENPARLALLRDHQVALPLIRFTKRDLWKEATRQGWADLLLLTWSCEGEDIDATARPCGNCQSCQARIVPATARMRVGT